MTQVVASVVRANRWSSRTIPLILLALIAIATYVVTGRICINILIPRHQQGAAIAVLVLLYSFLLLLMICYLRTFLTIIYNPGAVPLPLKSTAAQKSNRDEGHGYTTSTTTEEARRITADGMSQFWTKDVFECTDLGQSRWCSKCENWKPDRSHHSKELGRCIRKMDHYCPWMGGIISETSFKFFIQFNMYASFFCGLCMSISAYIVHLEVTEGAGLDAWIILIVVLGGFFGLFTFTLATNSMRFAYLNLTTIDIIDYKVATHYLAIRVSRGIPPSADYRLVTFPPPEIPLLAAGVNTFAVVQTRAGENPWDLGYYNNWKSIMGDSIIDWFLPLRSSPEISYDSIISEYPLGPTYAVLRSRYNLGEIDNKREKRGHRRRKHHTKH